MQKLIMQLTLPNILKILESKSERKMLKMKKKLYCHRLHWINLGSRELF